MAALAVNELPVGADWEYELKFDGSPDKTFVIST
jgi:hypothetical protein